MTDAELFAAYAKNRSQDAFRTLIERHAGLVYAAAIRQVRDPGMAQDVVQGVFMALAAKAPSLQSKAATLPGWLLIAARYGARNLLRSRAACTHHEREATVMKTATISTVDSEKLFSLLDQALSRLSSIDRTAVALYYFENRSMRHVSNALAVSEGAAQVRVSRALVRLRSILQSAGISCPSDALEESLHRNGAIAPPAAVLAAVANGMLHPATTASGASVAARGVLKSLLIKKVATMAIAAGIALAVAAPTVPLVYHAFSAGPNVTAISSANTPTAPIAPAASSAPSPFTATLPNGISIELLGFGDLSQKFWDPDGHALRKVPQVYTFANPPSSMVSAKQRALIWSARYEFPPTQDIGWMMNLNPVNSGSLSFIGSSDNGNLYSALVAIPKDQTTGTIHVDIATGPWQLMAASDGRETVTTHQPGFGDFVLSPPAQKRNYVVVTLSDNAHGLFQDQLMIIDVNGKQISPNGTTLYGGAAGQMTKRTADFNNISLNQIKQIRYEMRYFDQWIEFQNVSLVPNKHTTVQIDYGNNIN